MTRRRVAGRALVALLAPMGGLGLLLTAPPAHAAGGITSPGSGLTYTADTTLQVRADVSLTAGATELRLTSPLPGSVAQVVDSAGPTATATTLSYDLDTACVTYPSRSCTGSAPAPNGVWTVTLTGGASDSRQFTLRIPPRPPSGVRAEVTDGARSVVVSWRRGDEPDLTGWTVYAGDGGVVRDGIGADACSGIACSVTLSAPSARAFAISAHRAVAPGSSETLESPRSATVTAGSPSAGATPDTAGAPTGGGATPGATPEGAPAASGSTPAAASDPGAQRRAFALSFQEFGPEVAVSTAPSPAVARRPVAAPLPDGTYDPTLHYEDQVVREKLALPGAAEGSAGLAGTPLGNEQLVRSIAAALVLLLAGAHLRRWLAGSASAN